MYDSRKKEIQERVSQLANMKASWDYISTVVQASYGIEYLQFAREIFSQERGPLVADIKKNSLNPHSASAESPLSAEQIKPADRNDTEPAQATKESASLNMKNNIFIVPLWGVSMAVLTITAMLLILSLLFPPWYIVIENNMSVSLGYHFIATAYKKEYAAGIVNVSLLCCEFFVIIVVGFIALFVARQNEMNDEAKK
jgi:uncharacterized membrane protein